MGYTASNLFTLLMISNVLLCRHHAEWDTIKTTSVHVVRRVDHEENGPDDESSYLTEIIKNQTLNTWRGLWKYSFLTYNGIRRSFGVQLNFGACQWINSGASTRSVTILGSSSQHWSAVIKCYCGHFQKKLSERPEDTDITSYSYQLLLFNEKV